MAQRVASSAIANRLPGNIHFHHHLSSNDLMPIQPASDDQSHPGSDSQLFKEPDSEPNDLEESAAELVAKSKRAIAHPIMEGFIRLGFAAKGIVYLVIGLLAEQAAFDVTSDTADTEEALIEIIVQPFGEVLLTILAIGLCFYALWRFIQAILDPEHSDSYRPIRLLQRLGYAVSGLSYAGVAYTAIQLLTGLGNMTNEDSAEVWTEWLILKPFGEWLIGIGGLVVIGVGLTYMYGGYSKRYLSDLQSEQLDSMFEHWAIQFGRFGYAARGFVFVLIGFFLVKAALLSDAKQVDGLGGVLSRLAGSELGTVVLAIVAFGFISYAGYMMVTAWYRRFKT